MQHVAIVECFWNTSDPWLRHDCVLLRQLVTRGAEKDFVYARTSSNYLDMCVG